MKILTFFTAIICFCLWSNFTLAQEKKANRFGIQASFGNPSYIQSDADGAPSYDGKFFFDIGFLYLTPLSEKWEFETGLIYSSNKFKVTPNISPGFPEDPYDLNFNNWLVSANFRKWLPNRFFLQAGPNLSQTSRDSFGYFRLGFSLGLGKEFKMGEKYSLLISPTLNANPFFPTNWNGITQFGIRSIFAFPTKK
ncbi:hypothetical protein [Algoriphagus litoralis]|uniref:hypothetical protein n=1 Tax=Algoriphagus litoralis TaxID=2202829 RepID=UPI0013006964|nr:hypothetical protein [Algoriphagus litoralis]